VESEGGSVGICRANCRRRDGVATGLVGIPNLHSPVEVVCLEDMNRAAPLLAEFCAVVTAKDE
jgi:putative aminopeptidase FrvX